MSLNYSTTSFYQIFTNS